MCRATVLLVMAARLTPSGKSQGQGMETESTLSTQRQREYQA